MRLAFRILLILPASLLAVWLNLLLTFSDPAIQTWAARLSAELMSEKTGASFTIQRFSLGFKLQLVLEGVEVSDLHHNPMLKVSKIEIIPSSFNILKALKVRSVNLEKPLVNLVRYQGESEFNYQFLFDAFSGKGDTASTSSKEYPIAVSQITLHDGQFSYVIEGSDTVPDREMDYNRLIVSNINLKAHKLALRGDSISATIVDFCAMERCGLKINRLSTELSLKEHFVNARNLVVKVDETLLDLDLKMHFNGIGSFEYFIDSVQLEALMRPSQLQLAELGYFSEILFDMPNFFNFEGKAKGTVANFSADGFKLAFGTSTNLDADFSIRGLPDIYSANFNATIKQLATSVQDIDRFSLPVENGRINLPNHFKSLGNLSVRGMFNGTYSDFISRMSINSNLGYLAADVVLRTNPLSNKTSYLANLSTKQFAIGSIISDANLPGKTNLTLRLEGSGLWPADAMFNITGQISSVEMPDVVFSGIDFAAKYEEKILSADALFNDPKLSFNFSGTADFSDEKALYAIDLKLNKADLAAIGLVNTDSIFEISTQVIGQFSLTGVQDFVGLISLSDTRISNSKGLLDISNLQISVLEDPFLERKLLLQSDILQLEAGGKFRFSQLGNSVSQFLHTYFAHEALHSEIKDISEQDFYYNLRIKDFSGVSRLFIPQLRLSRNVSLTGVYMSATRIWQSTFFADTITYGTIALLKPHAVIRGSADKLDVNLRTQEFELYRSSDPETPSLGLEGALLRIDARADSLKIDLSWLNAGQLINRGTIKALLTAPDPSTAQFSILESDIIVNDTLLWFDKGGSIVLKGKQSHIDNFGIHLGTSNLLIDGMLPRGEADTLSLAFSQWELSNFSFLMAPYGITTAGRVNGDLTLSNLDNNPAIFSNLSISKLALNNEILGDARLMSSWSGIENNIYVNAQIINRGNVGSGRIFHLRGFYYPTRDENNISLNLQLENFRLKVLNSFLKGYVSEIEGFASGNIDIRGSLSKPELEGKIGLNRASFLIDYLNVRYSLQHEFPIEPGRFLVKDLMLIDTANNRAIANGFISHKNLRDFFIDVRLRPENLLALNTGPVQNELFYGTAVVSGEALIRGPFDNIDLFIRVISQRGTSVVIPIDLTTSVGTNDYISFVKQFNLTAISNDPVRQRAMTTTNFGINLETVITPDANLRIFMPYNTGTLDARGNGNLSIGVNAAGELTLNGEYLLQSGLFNFTFENIIKRRFDLIEGGRIAWAGDPYDATIDAKGVYKVKASLAGLGLDTTQNLSNRINVDCIIHLSNNLFNPNIRFGFRFPNLDSQIEQSIFTVIDTTNHALMTQQMISLLVIGSFASSSGIDNFSIGNSSLDVLSGQLSSWLSQISKDFDIGLYYRPGDQLSSEELEVALSTQLFNERVTIDGNFGMVNNRNTTQNASKLVGDFDINVKLTRDGRLRLRAYNHSNVNNWITSSAFDRYSPYTQGVGLFYRQEFDQFSELFRRKRKPNNQ